jgi:small subunit ribosomal protein S8
MVNDPIADLLTRVRNASKARLRKVDLPSSQMKVAIAEILKEHGFIRNYKLFRQEQKGVLRLYLKYVGKNRSVIQGLRRVSKPSRRVYASYRNLPKVMNGIGVAVVSTSRGIVTDEVARTHKVGGEVLCTIW